MMKVDFKQRVRVLKVDGDVRYLPIPDNDETPMDEFTPQLSQNQFRGLFQFDPRFSENCNNGTELDVTITVREIERGKAYSQPTEKEKKATTPKRTGKAGEILPESDSPGVVE